MRSTLVGILLASSSCGLFGPTVVCEESNLGGEMTCAEVLTLAREQLNGVSGITTLTAVQGSPCPADQAISCPEVPATAAVSTVYADLSDGRRIAVRVSAEDDDGRRLRADPPQDMGSTP